MRPPNPRRPPRPRRQRAPLPGAIPLVLTLAWGLLGLVGLASLSGQEETRASPSSTPPAAPGWVEITPNAIQERDQPMEIEVGGVPPGQRVRLTVLQDCDLDGRPEASEDCPPVFETLSGPADRRSRITARLVPGDLEEEPGALRNLGLWLRVIRPGADGTRSPARWARFGYGDDPCSLWETVVETFFGGECDPGLLQALRQHRGSSSLSAAVFEVRRLDLGAPDGEPEARPVPGTRGATGVAWEGPRTLLVTVGPALVSPPQGTDETRDPEAAGGTARLTPGLYRLDLTADEPPRRLWSPDRAAQPSRAPAPTFWPTAPLALPGGRVAFVAQRFGGPEHQEVGEPAPARLIVLDAPAGGVVSPSITHPLPRKIHRLVAHDPAGGSLLALSLGKEENRPAFLEIDLVSGDVDSLGYHPALYHAALHAPKSPEGAPVSAIAFEDSYGDGGWDLVLVDGHGDLLRDLAVGRGSDLLPAWSPDGDELAYLAETAPEAPDTPDGPP